LDGTPTVTRVVYGARYTTLGTTARSANNSISLQNSSVSNRSSIRTAMARYLGSGRTNNNSSRRAIGRRMRICLSRMPRGRSRKSMATPTPTPAMVALGTSRLDASSRCCIMQWQQLHQCQERCPTRRGWRCPSASTPPTAQRACQELGIS
jgi:hypothetical protein